MIYSVARTVAASLLSSQEARTPIDLDALCERTGVLSLKMELPIRIDGYHCVIDGRPVIVVNSNIHKPVARRRWTLAHELGEYLIAEEARRTGLKVTHTELHRAANTFARDLLAPPSVVAALWNLYSTNPGCRLSIIADHLEVSRSFIRLRAEQLKLG